MQIPVVHTGHQIQRQGDAFLHTIRQKRNPVKALSPNAKNITARRQFATNQIKRDGIRHIAPFLLFTSEAEMPAGTAAEPLIISKDEVILHKHFLPNAPDAQIRRTYSLLWKPERFISALQPGIENKTLALDTSSHFLLSVYVRTGKSRSWGW
ncbi:hypothetical protein EJ07DRAFT_156467 [Lizonia empirigonia]|nr:hypothetical protein EJ07DRAFT_156467 [Lizonia empirigonia]